MSPYEKKPRKDSYEVRVKPKLALVIGWCRRGLSNEQIAENLGISNQSFTNYLKRYEEFADAVDKGREETEIHVENALVKRALGYNYKEVTRERKLVTNPETGEEEYKLVVTKSVTKHVIPDVGAQQYYLEHRAPKRWERVPQAHIDTVQVNADIKSIAELLSNPKPERKIGDEELGE
jgi:predicted transcriptional regulator